jgi:FKBP-type peptidyl-prolyl cis-trans isomerase
MKKYLFALLIAAVAAGCGKEKCEYNECAVVAPASEIQSLQNYLTANNITATQHCSGIFYTVEQPGNGDWPAACDRATVRYQGRLTNGTIFDPRGGSGAAMSTADFQLNGLITGFTNGVLQIKEGGKVTIYIPPSLGYGSRQAGDIPPNSNLIFTVELVAIH